LTEKNPEENLLKFGVMKRRVDMSKAYTNQFIK
jgi:hypothetical protein